MDGSALSKPWGWETVEGGSIWETPSEDSHYCLHRWKEKGLSRMLDLGCGLGRHSIQFARAGFDVTAVDLSAVAVGRVDERSRELGLNIRTAVCDMSALPFENAIFDCLMAYHVISHTDSAGIIRIISEIGRVLKTGGEFFITLCSKEAWSYASAGYRKIDGNTVIMDEEPEKDVPHFFVNLAELKALLAGYDLLSIRHIFDIHSDYTGCHYFVLGRKR